MVDFTPIGTSIFFAGVEYSAALWSAMLVVGWGGHRSCVPHSRSVRPPSWWLGVWGGESGVRGGGGGSFGLKVGHHPHGTSTYIRMQCPPPSSPLSSPLFHSEFGVGGEETDGRTEARQDSGSRSALGVWAGVSMEFPWGSGGDGKYQESSRASME